MNLDDLMKETVNVIHDKIANVKDSVGNVNDKIVLWEKNFLQLTNDMKTLYQIINNLASDVNSLKSSSASATEDDSKKN